MTFGGATAPGRRVRSTRDGRGPGLTLDQARVLNPADGDEIVIADIALGVGSVPPGHLEAEIFDTRLGEGEIQAVAFGQIAGPEHIK